VDTLHRSVSHVSFSGRLELAGHAVIVAGFVVMTLGILEIGGLFNVGLGLALAWVGCVVLFAREGGRGLDEEAELLRRLDL
jgi:hypothetical protein